LKFNITIDVPIKKEALQNYTLTNKFKNLSQTKEEEEKMI